MFPQILLTGNAGNIYIIANGGAVSFGTGNVTAQAIGPTGNGGNITIDRFVFYCQQSN